MPRTAVRGVRSSWLREARYCSEGVRPAAASRPSTSTPPPAKARAVQAIRAPSAATVSRPAPGSSFARTRGSTPAAAMAVLAASTAPSGAITAAGTSRALTMSAAEVIGARIARAV